MLVLLSVLIWLSVAVNLYLSGEMLLLGLFILMLIIFMYVIVHAWSIVAKLEGDPKFLWSAKLYVTHDDGSVTIDRVSYLVTTNGTVMIKLEFKPNYTPTKVVQGIMRFVNKDGSESGNTHIIDKDALSKLALVYYGQSK